MQLIIAINYYPIKMPFCEECGCHVGAEQKLCGPCITKAEINTSLHRAACKYNILHSKLSSSSDRSEYCAGDWCLTNLHVDLHHSTLMFLERREKMDNMLRFLTFLLCLRRLDHEFGSSHDVHEHIMSFVQTRNSLFY